MIAVTSAKWQMSPHQFKRFLYSVHAFYVMSQGKIIITQSVLPFIANKWIGMAMCQCVFGSVQTYFQSNLTSSNLNTEFSGKPRLNQESFFCNFCSSLHQCVQWKRPSNTTCSRLIWFSPDPVSTLIIILFHSTFKIKIILHWSMNKIWILINGYYGPSIPFRTSLNFLYCLT